MLIRGKVMPEPELDNGTTLSVLYGHDGRGNVDAAVRKEKIF